MAHCTRLQSQRRRYARALGYAPCATDAPSHRFLLWDGRVRWVAVGAQLPYADATVLSGRHCRFCVSWCVDPDGRLTMRRQGWFGLGATRVSHNFDGPMPTLSVDGAVVPETLRFMDQKGALVVESSIPHCRVVRTLFAAVESVGLVECVQVSNLDGSPHTVAIAVPPTPTVTAGGVQFCVEMADDSGKMLSMLDIVEATATLQGEQTATFWVVYYAMTAGTDLLVDCRLEHRKHMAMVEECFVTTLCSHTPRPLLDAALAHAATWCVSAIADTPLGPLPLTMPTGCTLAQWALSVPYFALADNYRGRMAADCAAAQFGDAYLRGALPAGFTPEGTPYGKGDVWQFALGCCYCAQYNLRLGSELYRALRPALLARATTLRDAVPLALAALVCREMAVWAALVGQEADVALWRQTRHDLARRLTACVHPATGLYRTRVDQLQALVLPLLADIDLGAQACAVALGNLYDGHAAMAHRGKAVDDARLLSAVAALANAGYHDAAHVLLYNYTVQCLLGQGSPYPTDRRDLGAPPAFGSAIAYCYVATVALWGLRPMGNAFGLCLHFPAAWRDADLVHLHLGGRVVSLYWHDDHLQVVDLYDAVLYDGPLLCGQPLVVNL